MRRNPYRPVRTILGHPGTLGCFGQNAHGLFLFGTHEWKRLSAVAKSASRIHARGMEAVYYSEVRADRVEFVLRGLRCYTQRAGSTWVGVACAWGPTVPVFKDLRRNVRALLEEAPNYDNNAPLDLPLQWVA